LIVAPKSGATYSDASLRMTPFFIGGIVVAHLKPKAGLHRPPQLLTGTQGNGQTLVGPAIGVVRLAGFEEPG